MLAEFVTNTFYMVSAALFGLGVIMMVLGTAMRGERTREPKLAEDILQQRLDQIREAERRSIAASDRRREVVTARHQRYGSIG